MKKGMIVRVLVLPSHNQESIQVLQSLKQKLGTEVWVSLMSQYFPCYQALEHPILHRAITKLEYEEVQQAMENLGFENGWAQDME